MRFVLLAAAVAVFLLIFGCAGQPEVQPASQQEMPFGENPNAQKQGCTSYAPEECPSGCVVCPPCEACSSISCQSEQFCKSIGFNRSWWEEVKPKDAPGSQQQNSKQTQQPMPLQQPPLQQPNPQGNAQGPGLPSLNPNAPLPPAPENAPEGKLLEKNIGSVKAQYFSTAIARGLTQSGTDYFITLNNTGSSSAKICAPSCCSELRSFVPSWNLHFFSMQDFPIELKSGEVKKLWYFASLDEPRGFFNVTFKMWQCENEGSAVSLPVAFGATDERFWGKETSYLQGSVKDEEGNPIKGASVVALTGCGRVDFRGESDAQGKYAIALLGMEDIDAIYQGREISCDSKGYWIAVEKEGYGYYYADKILPTRSTGANADIVLKKKAQGAQYEMEWEKKVPDNYGFFWVKPSADWSVFAAAQSKHPPELNKPTNFYLFDASGNVLWKQPTQNECWGIDIAKDGSEVVAGCHDGYVYAVDRSGKLLWKYNENAMVRSACISADGKTVLSGTMGTLQLFDAKSGSKTDVKRSGDWLRNCAFYADNSGFVVGSRETGGFSSSGVQEWQQIIGEFPLFMGVDNNRNVYASGKSRTFFSFDGNGSVRWTHKIAEPTVTAGAVAPAVGKIAAGSVGGSVYLFDANGTLLWRRGALGFGEFSAVGHNAIAISQDGTRIVAGTDSNCVVLYDEAGTMLWKKCIEPDASNPELKMGVTNVQISPDKAKIIATYGDNYVRMFSLKQ
ncbi:Outer membrane protein assembly factor BamB [Candidatus Anstonella stagnisolia]|nr:Outer membrane protein assembly factor BamB [Candidatus Anstonella stagnisolia]